MKNTVFAIKPMISIIFHYIEKILYDDDNQNIRITLLGLPSKNIICNATYTMIDNSSFLLEVT